MEKRIVQKVLKLLQNENLITLEEEIEAEKLLSNQASE